MMNTKTAVAWTLIVAALSGHPQSARQSGDGQQAAVTPQFDVATVKANRSGATDVSMRFQPGGRFSAINAPLVLLIRNAYRLQSFQIVDVPPWFASEHFDIQAKAADEATTETMLEMLKQLLADRFKLASHVELRNMPVYRLTLVRGGQLGQQLKRTAVDCSRRPAPQPVTPPSPNARPICSMRIDLRGPLATVTAGGTTIEELAANLASVAGRHVVDGTGLAGGYDIDLAFVTPDAMMRAGAVDSGAGPSLFTAVQEQLGLRLESSNAPVNVFVIDRADRPTEN